MASALGIDVGTTNVKVGLVDGRGRLVARASRALESHATGDEVVQDAERLWRAVVDASREVAGLAPEVAADVGAVGVASQYSSIVPVDAAGIPVADLVMWSDQRGTDHSWAISDRHPDAFGVWLERHGIPPVGSGLALGHILHLQLDRPEVHAATCAYLEPMDYVTARLTGEITATQCTMFMSQLVDNRTVGVEEYDEELVRRSGVDAEKLPRLIANDGVVGALRPDVAAEMGLPGGGLVAAGMNDSQAGAFTSGAYGKGRGGVAIGTTAVLLDTVDEKKSDLENELVSMPSPVPDRYLAWAENGIAGRAVAHVLESVLLAQDELADSSIDEPFSRLDAVLDATDPGSGGLLFLPWLAGSLAPSASPVMRGGFLNLSLETTRPQLVRAMIEGTAHNLRWLLPALEGFTGQSIDEVAFYGGAARSAGWAQCLADVLDRPVRALPDPDYAVARTMALVALTRSAAIGVPDLSELGVSGRLYEPDPEVRDHLDLAHSQFVAAFEALEPIYRTLNG